METIEVRNLTKQYPGVTALQDVTLTIHENELFGLLGVNGAGKTTLIKILSGLAKQTSGTATVCGFSVPEQVDSVKTVVDVSPQETSVAPNLTVRENLDFFAGIYQKVTPEEIEGIVHTFSLEKVLDQRAKTLSGGWQRRLSIAIALLSKPKILFLDEPTLGLDVLARRELWKIIQKLKGSVTVILTSHYLEEIEALCDRVAVMVAGKPVALGTVEELKQQTGCEKFEDAFVKLAGGDLE